MCQQPKIVYSLCIYLLVKLVPIKLLHFCWNKLPRPFTWHFFPIRFPAFVSSWMERKVQENLISLLLSLCQVETCVYTVGWAGRKVIANLYLGLSVNKKWRKKGLEIYVCTDTPCGEVIHFYLKKTTRHRYRWIEMVSAGNENWWIRGESTQKKTLFKMNKR